MYKLARVDTGPIEAILPSTGIFVKLEDGDIRTLILGMGRVVAI
jgi:hypothetical protein